MAAVNVPHSALCPPSPGNPPPPLHQPITLPCGHTLSSAHVAIPPTPAITLNPTRATQAEWAAAVQKQQQQRLAIWCSLACPLPSCKKYSPSAAVVVARHPSILHEEEDEESVSSGSQRRGLVAQGLAFYPPLPSTAPAPAPAAAVHSSHESGLLDTTIDKVLSLVLREIAQRTHSATSPRLRSSFTSSDSEATDTSGDEGDEEDADSDGSQSFALLSQDRSPAAASFLPQRSGLQRTSSKRRRGAIMSPEVRGLPQARQGYAHGSAPAPGVQPDEWQFEKELLSHVECDVCALLLYEPVTTPCQHVGLVTCERNEELMTHRLSVRNVLRDLSITRAGARYAVKICRAFRFSKIMLSTRCCSLSVSFRILRGGRLLPRTS